VFGRFFPMSVPSLYERVNVTDVWEFSVRSRSAAQRGSNLRCWR
jgi:hypothetical protein